MWKRVNAEERKDVFEDVVFSLAKKEKEQEKRQRERNCLYLAKILKRMDGVTQRSTWAEASGHGSDLPPGILERIVVVFVDLANSTQPVFSPG